MGVLEDLREKGLRVKDVNPNGLESLSRGVVVGKAGGVECFTYVAGGKYYGVDLALRRSLDEASNSFVGLALLPLAGAGLDPDRVQVWYEKVSC